MRVESLGFNRGWGSRVQGVAILVSDLRFRLGFRVSRAGRVPFKGLGEQGGELSGSTLQGLYGVKGL